MKYSVNVDFRTPNRPWSINRLPRTSQSRATLRHNCAFRRVFAPRTNRPAAAVRKALRR